MINEDYKRLEKLGPEKLQQIAEFVKRTIQEEDFPSTHVQKVSGGQERLLKIQLRAFERIPSDIIAKYMNKEERQEYEVLRYAYE